MRSAVKEPHTFNRWDYRHDFERYHTELAKSPGGENILDGTPDYLKLPLAALRIKAQCNYQRAPKFIVSLCDPVQRAWKHYRHRLLWLSIGNVAGGGNLPREAADLERIFEVGVLNEIRLLEECLPRFDYQQCGEVLFGGWQNVQERRDVTTSGGSTAPCIGVVAGSMYDEQLEYWFKLFPRDDFLFLNTTKALADPSWLIRKVAAFTGETPVSDFLETSRSQAAPRVNVNSKYTDSDLHLPKTALSALMAFFDTRRRWEAYLSND